jgi:hypothetical protein
LEKFGGETFTKSFGESDNDKLWKVLKEKNQENSDKLAQLLFNATIPRMVDYLREFEAKKHIE